MDCKGFRCDEEISKDIKELHGGRLHLPGANVVSLVFDDADFL